MSEIINLPDYFHQYLCYTKANKILKYDVRDYWPACLFLSIFILHESNFYWYRMVKIIDPPGCFHHINIHVAWKQFLATLVALHFTPVSKSVVVSN